MVTAALDPIALGVACLVAGAIIALVRGVSLALDHDHRVSRSRLDGIAQAGPMDPTPRQRSRRRQRAGSSSAGLRRWLRQAGLKWEVADLVGVTVASALLPAVALAVLVGPGFLALTGGLAGALLPFLVVHRRAHSRSAALNAQIVETLEIVASSLRSGFGFVQSVELAAREQRDPIATELTQCIREINLGASTDEALTRLVERAGDPDLELAVDAVVIQRRVGGDLSEVLGNIAHMIRERIRIRGEINTLTAQARMSSWIIGLLPAALAGAMALLQPEHMRLLIEHPVGRLMVGVAILMEAVGFILIRRIANIEY